MKKLLLSALLGLMGFAAFAGNKGTITDLTGCGGTTITVQFIQYNPGGCINNGTSPVYTVSRGFIYDLDDRNLWLPTILQSYQSFSAIICITCPGGMTFCLPPIGITPGAPPCDPTTVGPVPGCCGPVSVTNNPPGGGGIDWNLDIF